MINNSELLIYKKIKERPLITVITNLFINLKIKLKIPPSSDTLFSLAAKFSGYVPDLEACGHKYVGSRIVIS